MFLSTLQEPPADIQQQLNMATSQLALYARDLKRVVDAERQRTRELAASNERLRLLDHLKTNFLAFISHELRTPLNAMAAVDLFDPHDDPQQQALVIGLIRDGYEHLHKFIQRGLEYFSWLTAERVQTTDITDLAEVVHLVVAGMPELQGPGVDFQMTSSGTPCLIRGELRPLADVVRIVLDNALKFAQTVKSIRLQVQATPEQVIMTSSDRGQGFQKELAHELFHPFTISNIDSHSRGTGLNLALARAIVEAYGGRIQAHSEGVGQGATFTITFPAANLAPGRMAGEMLL